MKKIFVPYVNVQLLTNGNLEMSLTSANRQFMKREFPFPFCTKVAEQTFVKTYLERRGYKEIKPEDCGALTDATLITDGKDVWGDMNYAVISFLEELVKGNKVIWKKG